MRLSVLNVAYPFAPASSDAVGGAEQVVAQLDAALVAAGHESIVLAGPGSRVAGRLVELPPVARVVNDMSRSEMQRRCAERLRAIMRERAVDLVHLHGVDFAAYLPPPGPPVLVTLHLPLDWYSRDALRPTRPRTVFNCVSAIQRRAAPTDVPFLPDIENGVPDSLFKVRLTRRNFALALGRICPEKGFHIALDAARRAAIPLLLGGAVFPYETHQAYFRDEIVPRLNRQRRFIGPVGFARKRRLLAAARCVVIPSLVPETASLVAMEALACGTPVVAFPAGALAEIVEHGRTGFLVTDVDEMAAAIEAARSLRPEHCREAAWHRFRASRTAARYLAVYQSLVDRAWPLERALAEADADG